MSCEKWQNKTLKLATILTSNSPDKQVAAALATDLVLNRVPYKSSHTSRILAELSGIKNDPDRIPDFLRKTPKAQEFLVKHGILEKVET